MPTLPDVSLSLALAMVTSSTAPLLLLDGDLSIIAASNSFCREFDFSGADLVGQRLRDIGDGEWALKQLDILLSATADGDAEIEAYEMDLKTGAGRSQRLVIHAQKLDYGPAEKVRLLVTVSDVTDARTASKLQDDLLREKAVLLQEVQHRVANSLQIIASVILQSARKVQSEDTRMHLQDAHNRVMSVAALQQQLSATQLGAIDVRGYFIKLCQSIGASMIHDHDQITLKVEADDAVVTPDTSISLGLIVTELVINALKHGFPEHRRGAIVVGYTADGADWTLTISDDGVGMSAAPFPAKPGLGTSIVQALANQLGAVIDVQSANPGTRVSVTHKVADQSTQLQTAA